MAANSRTIRIGRESGCDVVLSDLSVSRRHAELVIADDGTIELSDLKSRGGTYLLRGGRETQVERVKVQATDVVRLGEYKTTIAALLDSGPRIFPTRPPDTSTPAPKPPTRSASRLVRCSCGAVKERGQPCPHCKS